MWRSRIIVPKPITSSSWELGSYEIHSKLFKILATLRLNLGMFKIPTFSLCFLTFHHPRLGQSAVTQERSKSLSYVLLFRMMRHRERTLISRKVIFNLNCAIRCLFWINVCTSKKYPVSSKAKWTEENIYIHAYNLKKKLRTQSFHWVNAKGLRLLIHLRFRLLHLDLQLKYST